MSIQNNDSNFISEERLLQYSLLVKEMNRKQEEINFLRQKLNSIGALGFDSDRVDTTTKSENITEKLDEILELEKEIKELYTEIGLELEFLVSMFRNFDDLKRAILTMKYISNWSFTEMKNYLATKRKIFLSEREIKKMLEESFVKILHTSFR